MNSLLNKKMLPFFTVLLFSLFVMTAKADGVTPKNGDEDPSPTPVSKLTVGKVISGKSSSVKKYVFKGSVMDVHTNMPVKGAKVTMKGTNVGVVTDTYGLYLFTIPENLVKENMFFEINYPGYERKSFFIDKDLLPMVEQGIDGRIKRFMK